MDCRETTLKKLNREHGIVSARRPPPEHTLIAKQMAENVTSTNGPNTIRKRVALQDGVPIARQVFWSLLPSSISVFTGVRAKVAQLVVFHPSGHRKLCEWAAPASTCMVADFMVVVILSTCQWCPTRESTGGIPIQITVDGGTETQYMFQFHEQLQAQFLPDVSSTEVPACVALKSSDNIPIEALWSYFLKYTGHDLKAAILLGKTENYINIANEFHMYRDLFHSLWSWSRIVQIAVNQFVRYSNTHKTRKQSNKYLPSGVAPEDVFQHPENFGLRHAGIPLDLNVVRELRNTLPKSRRTAFVGFRLTSIYV
ncbi:hypothetical protein C8R45DRAFT_932038 [Mycena sanguinolenta]|nr:hypothetical protein C8R45DRAFT_932038 [Mycena sanguinolenta]